MPAPPSTSAGDDRTRQLLVAGVVILVMGLIAAAVFWTQSAGGSTRPVPTVPVVSASGYALAVGKRSAPVHVVVYEDFQCPLCRRFEMAARDFLRLDAAVGKVYVEYRPVASTAEYSRRALNAFVAVLDTSPGHVALSYHDLLFDRQPAEQGPWPGNTYLVTLAGKAGAVRTAVAGPVKTMKYRSWLTGANVAARKAHLAGTPTVVVDGKQLSGSSVEQIALRLERLIAKQG